MGWYVGLTKSGKAKKGSKTWYPPFQKAIQFVTKKQTVFTLPSDVVKSIDVSAENMNGNLTVVPPGTPGDTSLVFPPNIKFIDDDDETTDVIKTTTVNRVLHDLSADNN